MRNITLNRAPFQCKFASALSVLLFWGGLGCNQGKDATVPSAPTATQTAAQSVSVQRRDLIRKVTVTGTIVPKRRSVIVSPYNGYIQKLFVKLGSHVGAQDPLVSVSQTPTASRSEEVYPLRAPFTGTVVQVLRQEGEFIDVVKDSVILRLDDLTQLWINSDVPEIYVSTLRPGQEVVVRASAILTRTYKGAIREISIASKDKSNQYNNREKVEFPVRMEITERDEQLRPGMSVIVDIIAGRANQALTLPHEYVEKQGSQYFVTLESGERKEVKVGLRNEEAFEILEGLKESDKVKLVDYLNLPSQKP